MTLFKQIAILVSFLFLILMAVTSWNNFRHTNMAMEEQLQTSAQSMATTLGVVIANSDIDDTAFVETLFNVIFDSGYLVNIQLTSPEGKTLHSKWQKVSVQGVPDWLTELVPMNNATGRTTIMRGWVQYGTLRITLHPGHAYRALYNNIKSTIIWFISLSIIGLLGLSIMLRYLLKPLRQIEQQANAIIENRFVLQEEMPGTVELFRTTQAMNRMVERIQSVFNKEAESLKIYHDQLYRDELTGLGNRRHFITLLDELCQDEATRTGCVMAINLHGIDEIKKQYDFMKSDEVIIALATIMQSSTQDKPDKFCIRVDQSEFAIYLNNTISSVQYIAKDFVETFRTTAEKLGVNELCYLSLGIAELDENSSTSSILSELDYSLVQARATGEYAIHHRAQSNLNLPQGRTQWRAWISTGLEDHRFFLVFQPSNDMAGQPDHFEALVRLKDENQQVISAGVIMPLVDELDMNHELEFEIFRMALQPGLEAHHKAIAINVSSHFFTDVRTLAAIEQLIEKQQGHSAKLLIESSHFILNHHMTSAPMVVEQIRRLGCNFGIDNLDLSLPLELLQQLRPDYVKISARLLLDMFDEHNSASWSNLRSMTNGLGIRLIAIGIDSDDMLKRIEEIGVDGVQGYYIGKPEVTA